MARKFKYGDYVYIKAYKITCLTYEQVIRYDDDKKMYILIAFDPEDHDPTAKGNWSWCYAKEEDIEFNDDMRDNDDPSKQIKPIFSPKIELLEENYEELYDCEYYLHEKYTNGEISEEQFYKEYKEYCIKKYNIKSYPSKNN